MEDLQEADDGHEAAGGHGDDQTVGDLPFGSHAGSHDEVDGEVLPQHRGVQEVSRCDVDAPSHHPEEGKEGARRRQSDQREVDGGQPEPHRPTGDQLRQPPEHQPGADDEGEQFVRSQQRDN